MKQTAKAEMKWQITNLQAELTERRDVGNRMATLCHDVSQRKADILRAAALGLHKEWHAIEGYASLVTLSRVI
jgi:hypothetical protein